MSDLTITFKAQYILDTPNALVMIPKSQWQVGFEDEDCIYLLPSPDNRLRRNDAFIDEPPTNQKDEG